MTAPLIVMVGADKGGVGKTTVCRSVLDYFAAQGVPTRVFDTEHPSGDLTRFAPSARVIDIGRVPDQMLVFDQLDTAGVTVVDVRAGLLSPTLRALDEVRLLEDVRSGAVALALLHVLGPTISSLAEMTEAAQLIGREARHYLVKNHINDTGFFDWDSDGRYAEYFRRMQSVTIVVPRLKEIACETVQKVGGSFQAFARNEAPNGAPASHSRVLRGYVRSWLDETWRELDRVGLGELAVRSIAQTAPPAP